jgi:hypothetical protein
LSAEQDQPTGATNDPPAVDPADEPATAEPAADEPATAGEPAADEPATAGEPAADEPATAVEPAADEPATAGELPVMEAFSPLYAEDPARYSRSGWEYPVSWEDRLSKWSHRAIRASLVLGLLCLATVVMLWAVPSWTVHGSPAYAAAWERVQQDRRLERALGPPLEREGVPTSYTLRDGDRSGRLEFVVRGAHARDMGLGPEVLIVCEVEDGEVVRYGQSVYAPLGGLW